MINRFKQMRKELNLTLEEVAKALKLSQGAVANWEYRGELPTDRAYQIANVFGVNIDWLLHGEGEMLVKNKNPLEDIDDEQLTREYARRLFRKLKPEIQQEVIRFAESLLEEQDRCSPSYQQSFSGNNYGTIQQNNR